MGAKYDHFKLEVRTCVHLDLNLDVQGACLRPKKWPQPMLCIFTHNCKQTCAGTSNKFCTHFHKFLQLAQAAIPARTLHTFRTRACKLRASKMQVERSCRCRGILDCKVAGAATQNRLQVMLWQLCFAESFKPSGNYIWPNQLFYSTRK